MFVFDLLELLAVCGFLYLAANLLRYFFFKKSPGGGFFRLSDQWLASNSKKGRA
jgi:hypothetical protein